MTLPYRFITFASVALFSPLFAEEKPSYIPTNSSFTENAEWMRKRVETMVQTNRGELPDGRVVFYADALRHYNLIFTRGFGYIYKFADDLIADSKKQSLAPKIYKN